MEEITFNLNDGLWYYIYEHLAKDTGGIQPWQFILLTSAFVIISIVAGYLLGSVNSAIIVSRVFYNDDIRRHGSGNAGLTNILRTYGKGAAGFTLLGDFLKTAIAVAIGGLLGGFGYFGGLSIGGVPQGTFPLAYIAGLFSIIGHVYPIFYKFKGGKGVATSIAVLLMMEPLSAAACILVFLVLVIGTRYISLGSVGAAFLAPVFVDSLYRYSHVVVEEYNGELKGVGIQPTAFQIVSIVVIALLVIFKHRANLKRLYNGEESKFYFKKSVK